MNTISSVGVFHAEIENHQQLAVDARELHCFLGVQTRFNDWIKNRIKEYGFVKNQDYISFTENLVKPKNGRKSVQYYITLDMAKELAMVEKNAKGREIRQYFIKCEKQSYSLAAQITKLSIMLEEVDINLSNAGRYLAIHGKQTKPTLKGKISDLLKRAQPLLPEFDGGAK